jgi:hypothetical protein
MQQSPRPPYSPGVDDSPHRITLQLLCDLKLELRESARLPPVTSSTGAKSVEFTQNFEYLGSNMRASVTGDILLNGSVTILRDTTKLSCCCCG